MDEQLAEKSGRSDLLRKFRVSKRVSKVACERNVSFMRGRTGLTCNKFYVPQYNRLVIVWWIDGQRWNKERLTYLQ